MYQRFYHLTFLYGIQPSIHLDKSYKNHSILLLTRVASSFHCALLFFLDNAFRGKNYVHKPKMTRFKCDIVIIPTLTDKVSYWRSASPRSRLHIYWTFAFSESVPGMLSGTLKFNTNNNNSSSFPFFKQGRFKFIHVQLFWRMISTQLNLYTICFHFFIILTLY